ncbi:hypothetical protein ACK3TF_003654 [Chlorella vulgaris]
MSTNVPVPALDLTSVGSGESELARKPSFSKKMSTKFKNLVTPRGSKPSSTSPNGTAPDIAKSSITSLFRVPSLPRNKEAAVPAPATAAATAPQPAAAARAPAATPTASTAAAPAPAAGAAPVFAPITAPVAPPRPAVTAAAVPSSAPAPAVAAPAAPEAPPAVAAPSAPALVPAPVAAAPAAPVAAPAPAAREPAVLTEAPTPAKPVPVLEDEALLAAPEPATPGSAEWEQQATLEQSTSASEHSVTAAVTPVDAPADEAASVKVATPAKDSSPLTAKVKAPPRPGTREGKGLSRGLLTFAVLAVAAGLAINGSKKAKGSKPAPAILLVNPVGKTGWGRK